MYIINLAVHESYVWYGDLDTNVDFLSIYCELFSSCPYQIVSEGMFFNRLVNVYAICWILWTFEINLGLIFVFKQYSSNDFDFQDGYGNRGYDRDYTKDLYGTYPRNPSNMSYDNRLVVALVFTKYHIMKMPFIFVILGLSWPLTTEPQVNKKSMWIIVFSCSNSHSTCAKSYNCVVLWYKFCDFIIKPVLPYIKMNILKQDNYG